jgi:hypothetical protein
VDTREDVEILRSASSVVADPNRLRLVGVIVSESVRLPLLFFFDGVFAKGD